MSTPETEVSPLEEKLRGEQDLAAEVSETFEAFLATLNKASAAEMKVEYEINVSQEGRITSGKARDVHTGTINVYRKVK